jgi:hypothetical protein
MFALSRAGTAELGGCRPMGISADPLFQPRDGDLSYTELDTLRA